MTLRKKTRSMRGKGGHALTRLISWKSTMRRMSSWSCQEVPCCRKCFTSSAAGRPRLTSIWV